MKRGVAVNLALAFVFVCGCNLDSDLPSPLADAPADVPTPPRVTIAELRALPDGPVDVLLEPAYVTYVKCNQSNACARYLQVAKVGPAVILFTFAAQPPPDVEIGNQIELHVTELLTFDGKKEIVEATIVSNDRENVDLGTLSQLLTTAPNEELESELVRITGGTIVSAAPPSFQVRLESNVMIEMFSPFVGMEAGLCPGATFDAVGVVEEFNGAYNVSVVVAGDLTNVNTDACP